MFGLILGAISLIGSVAGSASQNRAAGKAFEQSGDKVTADYFKQIGQLEEQAKSADDAIRLEMTSQRFNGLQDSAVTSNVIVEREIAGNTASKLYNQSLINQMMTHNALAKKAEDSMASFGAEMENAQAMANNALYGAQAQAQANSVSTTQTITGAIGAGISGYNTGSNLGSVFGSTSNTGVLSDYQSVLER